MESSVVFDQYCKKFEKFDLSVTLCVWELEALLDSYRLKFTYFTFLIKRQDLIIMKSFQDSDLKLYILWCLQSASA